MTFVRHFITAGVDPNFGLELEDSSCSSSASSSSSATSPTSVGYSASSGFNPLERAYRPRILRKFPNNDGGLASLNEDILCRLILPQGLRFCTQKEFDALPQSVCHPFVLTREDGEKCYGISIIFYEEVKDINICHAVHTLQVSFNVSQ